MAHATIPSSGKNRKEKTKKQQFIYVVLVLRFDNGGIFFATSTPQTGGSLLCKPDSDNRISLQIDIKSQIILREKQRDRGQVMSLCMSTLRGCARFN